ncbi:MAG: four helix bundle protein [Muribaculaceae bacterium]|nr:four helix bundle protein [Muribaculaceae bacterium]
MSKSNPSNGREKRPDSSISIVVTTEELNAYLFKITTNEKQFPKSMRYTLSSDIRTTSLSICKKVYRGCSKKPQFYKDFKKIREIQDDIFDLLTDLKCLLHVSVDVANPNNPLQMASLYDAVVDSFNKWVKHTKRAMKLAKEREEYTPEMKREMRIKFYDRQAKLMDHDSDGFVVLKKAKS